MSSGAHTLHRHTDVAALRSAALPFLEADEIRNSLVLGIVNGMPEVLDPERGAHVYLATVADPSGETCGVVLRTIPRQAVTTDLPGEAIGSVVDGLLESDAALPGVHAPAETAHALRAAWRERTGGVAQVTMSQRLHALEAVEPGLTEGGSLHAATADERDLVVAWRRTFIADIGESLDGVDDGVVDRLIAGGRVFLWSVAGAHVATACVPSRMPHGAGITMVYTPLEQRGRGYGTAVTAALSQRLLDEGLDYCSLFTDLANPTSNSIYARIGYRPVADFDQVAFRYPQNE